MYVRMSTREGLDAAGIDMVAARINAADGPPAGVPASRFMMLADRENGRALMIGVFETAEDRATADAALRAMEVPAEAGSLTSVDFYDLLVEKSGS